MIRKWIRKIVNEVMEETMNEIQDNVDYTNIEDKVRIDKNYTPNILTATFKKL